jgi:hypothetical protein
VAADGSSPNKNHGSSHIAAAVSAACLVAAASIRPRRTVPVHNYGDYDDDDDDDLHGSNKRRSKRKSANPNNDDDNVKMNTTKSLRSRGKKKKVVYEEVDDEEEDDNEDGPEDFRRETSKAKKLTKTEAKLLATELLNDRLEPLNRPNDTNWLNIVSTLDVTFGELEPAAKDELVHQLCIQLVIDVDYDKYILMLKRLFADIDRDGECINNDMSRHTFRFCH